VGEKCYGFVGEKLDCRFSIANCRFLSIGNRQSEIGNALLFVAELVPDAPDGQDHLRVLRILLNLGPQTIDM
jgi:hypothetical protein